MGGGGGWAVSGEWVRGGVSGVEEGEGSVYVGVGGGGGSGCLGGRCSVFLCRRRCVVAGVGGGGGGGVGNSMPCCCLSYALVDYCNSLL